MSPTFAVIMVFVGCMANVIFLEAMVKEDPGAGNLITFTQFAFIALEGVIFTSKFGIAKPHIKISEYSKVVIIFFMVNLLNNYAFNFNVPVPLHIIIRSGSLITNMIMGVRLLNKSYKMSKYVSVILITLGIVLCTIVSGREVKSTATRGPPTTPYEDFYWWSMGVLILIVALFLSAILGVFQEALFKRYGKHPREACFYTHLIPLPLFVGVWTNLTEHLTIAYNSEPYLILDTFEVPKLALYLLGNAITQYICINSVYVLTTECSSLVVTLVLTLRKFASLLFSVIYFENSFTFYHWVGTILVLIGTVIFTELHQKFFNSIISQKHVPQKKDE